MKTYKNPQIPVMIANYEKALASGSIVVAMMIKRTLFERHGVHVGPSDQKILEAMRMVPPGERIIKS